MKKQGIIYLLIIILLVNNNGCSKNNKINNDSKQNHIQGFVKFSDSVSIDNKVMLFFDSYFNDQKLKNIDNYFLLIFQTNDTTLLDINIVNAEFIIKEIKPIAIIKYMKKNIFIINNEKIFHIENCEITKQLWKYVETTQKEYCFFEEKHWLLAIDNFTNESRIIKNEDEIRNIILHWKVIESPIKFNATKKGL